MVLAVLQCFFFVSFFFFFGRGGACLPLHCFSTVIRRHVAGEQDFFKRIHSFVYLFIYFWHQVGGIEFAMLDGMCCFHGAHV